MIDSVKVEVEVEVEVEVDVGPVTVTFFRASPASPWPSARHRQRGGARVVWLRRKRRR
ncbi:hypothetical protein DV517_60700 [Streptomyces sp. S816]|uniref:hypothetical protein n=1 Tax=Streptomyces sp. S816 TaxID=2283197 RepID=UPI00113E08C4|nr:hypothetical protein [Streptomyces sp. S816]TGZ14587.1 hypothetical protein DV517_60700 [Streptomyces sp. S816]